VTSHRNPPVALPATTYDLRAEFELLRNVHDERKCAFARSFADEYEVVLRRAPRVWVPYDLEGQYYTATVDLVSGGMYEVAWDVGAANALVKEGLAEYMRLPWQELQQGVYEEQLDPEGAAESGLAKKYPIIVAAYPVSTPPFMVSEGNHRIARAWRAQDTTTLKVHLLTERQQMAVMCGQLHRILYLFHHNLAAVLQWLEDDSLDAHPELLGEDL
jgi:hypothetical protein